MMRAISAIAGREWASMLRTPSGWIVIALYLLLSGIAVAVSTVEPGVPASLRQFFGASHLIMLVVAPAIAMRLMSEEFRAGTIEPLMAAPISDWAIVIGKYLGGVAFLLTLLAPTLLYVALLEWLSDPDYGPILAGYLGLTLLGMLYIAVGLLVSSLTRSTVVALLGTLFALMVIELAAGQGSQHVGQPYARILEALSVRTRLADFAKGVIDTAHIAFFLLTTGWFVCLAAVATESRRWR